MSAFTVMSTRFPQRVTHDEWTGESGSSFAASPTTVSPARSPTVSPRRAGHGQVFAAAQQSPSSPNAKHSSSPSITPSTSTRSSVRPVGADTATVVGEQLSEPGCTQQRTLTSSTSALPATAPSSSSSSSCCSPGSKLRGAVRAVVGAISPKTRHLDASVSIGSPTTVLDQRRGGASTTTKATTSPPLSATRQPLPEGALVFGGGAKGSPQWGPCRKPDGTAVLSPSSSALPAPGIGATAPLPPPSLPHESQVQGRGIGEAHDPNTLAESSFRRVVSPPSPALPLPFATADAPLSAEHSQQRRRQMAVAPPGADARKRHEEWAKHMQLSTGVPGWWPAGLGKGFSAIVDRRVRDMKEATAITAELEEEQRERQRQRREARAARIAAEKLAAEQQAAAEKLAAAQKQQHAAGLQLDSTLSSGSSSPIPFAFDASPKSTASSQSNSASRGVSPCGPTSSVGGSGSASPVNQPSHPARHLNPFSRFHAGSPVSRLCPFGFGKRKTANASAHDSSMSSSSSPCPSESSSPRGPASPAGSPRSQRRGSIDSEKSHNGMSPRGLAPSGAISTPVSAPESMLPPARHPNLPVANMAAQGVDKAPGLVAFESPPLTSPPSRVLSPAATRFKIPAPPECSPFHESVTARVNGCGVSHTVPWSFAHRCRALLMIVGEAARYNWRLTLQADGRDPDTTLKIPPRSNDKSESAVAGTANGANGANATNRTNGTNEDDGFSVEALWFGFSVEWSDLRRELVELLRQHVAHQEALRSMSPGQQAEAARHVVMRTSPEMLANALSTLQLFEQSFVEGCDSDETSEDDSFDEDDNAYFAQDHYQRRGGDHDGQCVQVHQGGFDAGDRDRLVGRGGEMLAESSSQDWDRSGSSATKNLSRAMRAEHAAKSDSDAAHALAADVAAAVVAAGGLGSEKLGESLNLNLPDTPIVPGHKFLPIANDAKHMSMCLAPQGHGADVAIVKAEENSELGAHPSNGALSESDPTNADIRQRRTMEAALTHELLALHIAQSHAVTETTVEVDMTDRSAAEAAIRQWCRDDSALASEALRAADSAAAALEVKMASDAATKALPLPSTNACGAATNYCACSENANGGLLAAMELPMSPLSTVLPGAQVRGKFLQSPRSLHTPSAGATADFAPAGESPSTWALTSDVPDQHTSTYHHHHHFAVHASTSPAGPHQHHTLGSGAFGDIDGEMARGGIALPVFDSCGHSPDDEALDAALRVTSRCTRHHRCASDVSVVTTDGEQLTATSDLDTMTDLDSDGGVLSPPFAPADLAASPHSDAAQMDRRLPKDQQNLHDVSFNESDDDRVNGADLPAKTKRQNSGHSGHSFGNDNGLNDSYDSLDCAVLAAGKRSTAPPSPAVASAGMVDVQTSFLDMSSRETSLSFNGKFIDAALAPHASRDVAVAAAAAKTVEGSSSATQGNHGFFSSSEPAPHSLPMGKPPLSPRHSASQAKRTVEGTSREPQDPHDTAAFAATTATPPLRLPITSQPLLVTDVADASASVSTVDHLRRGVHHIVYSHGQENEPHHATSPSSLQQSLSPSALAALAPPVKKEISPRGHDMACPSLQCGWHNGGAPCELATFEMSPHALSPRSVHHDAIADKCADDGQLTKRQPLIVTLTRAELSESVIAYKTTAPLPRVTLHDALAPQVVRFRQQAMGQRRNAAFEAALETAAVYRQDEQRLAELRDAVAAATLRATTPVDGV